LALDRETSLRGVVRGEGEGNSFARCLCVEEVCM